MDITVAEIVQFLIVLVVVIGLAMFILGRIAVDQTIKNIVLAVLGLVFLLWFLNIAGLM